MENTNPNNQEEQHQKDVHIDIAEITKQAGNIFREAKKEIENNLNVLIVGKTGVGKSTLINTVFGSDVAKTGSGKPVTQEIQRIDVNRCFTIYDTKGLEMKDFETTFENIKNFLDENAKKDANSQINIVWFCIAEPGRRIEEGEKRLFNLFKEKSYTTIVAITKSQQDKDENGHKFSDIVKEEFQISDVIMQRVRAMEVEDDDGDVKKIIGIDELIKKTYDKLPEASKQAFAREQQYNKKIKEEAALEIINKYSMTASAIAATPIPFSDIALLLPTQVAMITHITSVYGFDVSPEGIAKLTGSFVVAAGIGFATRAVVGNMLKLIPVVGQIAGLSFNALVAGSVTRLIGNAYLAFLNDNFELIYSGDFDLMSKLTSSIIEEYINKQKNVS